LQLHDAKAQFDQSFVSGIAIDPDDAVQEVEVQLKG
jgi:hypothetical protein